MASKQDEHNRGQEDGAQANAFDELVEMNNPATSVERKQGFQHGRRQQLEAEAAKPVQGASPPGSALAGAVGSVGGAMGSGGGEILAGGGKYVGFVFLIFMIALWTKYCNPNAGKPYRPTTLPTGITSGPSGTSFYTGEGDPLAFQADNDGNYFLQQSKYDQAILYFTEAIRRNPNYEEAYLGRGAAYAGLERAYLAFEDYNAAVRLRPDDAKAYYDRALSEQHLGQQQEAVNDFTHALMLNPTESRDVYYRARGTAYLMLNQFQPAIGDFNETLRLKPNDSFSMGNRGLAYTRSGEYEAALRDYNNALGLDPNNASLHEGRAVLYSRLNQYQQAIPDLDEEIRLDPKEPRAFESRGLAYAHLDQYNRAVEDFTRAIKLKPDSASAYEYRGIAYQNLGSFDLAVQDFDEALRLDPTLTRASAARESARAGVGATVADTTASASSSGSAPADMDQEQAGSVDSVPPREQEHEIRDCYNGSWHENELNQFTWSFERQGPNSLRIRRNDGFVSGTFQKSAEGWTGFLTWGNGTQWDGVVLHDVNDACNEITTNQRWWYKR
jgi:tetratricopeptide (TPR) repeat protein